MVDSTRPFNIANPPLPASPADGLYAKVNLFIQNCIDGNLKEVQRWLKEGFNPNRGDDRIYTALHCLCEHEWNDSSFLIATHLCVYGANVNADSPSHDGWTPLHLAAWTGNHQACQFLLNNGGNPTLTDWFGASPLQVAEYSEHSALATVKLLQEATMQWTQRQKSSSSNNSSNNSSNTEHSNSKL